MRIFRVPTSNQKLVDTNDFITVPWMQALAAIAQAVTQYLTQFTTGSLSITTTSTSVDTMGRSILIGGTVVVPSTQVTATSNIFITNNVPGGTPGFLRISARTAGVSFTILSSNGADTSTISWLIIQPA